MSCLLKLGGSFLADLTAAREVLDFALASRQVTAVMVGTGYPFEWYSARLVECDRKVKGTDRLQLSAACQSANEIVLTILDGRVIRTTRENLRQAPLSDRLQLLHLQSFLDGKLEGPMGSDCKAIVIARDLKWNRVILAKRRNDLPPAGPLQMAVIRERYPKLIDRGFEDLWPQDVRTYVLPALEPERLSANILEASLEVTR